jgi:hypothetical protein
MTFFHLEQAFLQSNALSLNFVDLACHAAGLSEISNATTKFRGRLSRRMAVG